MNPTDVLNSGVNTFSHTAGGVCSNEAEHIAGRHSDVAVDSSGPSWESAWIDIGGEG
jgi:hypothetical protein